MYVCIYIPIPVPTYINIYIYIYIYICLCVCIHELLILFSFSENLYYLSSCQSITKIKSEDINLQAKIVNTITLKL